MQLLVILIAVFAPLVITPGLLFHFDITPKVAILLLGVSGALIFCRRAALDQLALLCQSRIGRVFLIVVVLEVAWTGCATLLSSDLRLSLDGSEWRRMGLYVTAAIGILSLMAAPMMRDPAFVLRLLRLSLLSGAVVAGYGILQYFGWDPFLPAAAYHAGEDQFRIVRPPGTLGHADYFAAYLLYVTFGCLALHATAESRSIRQACLAGGALGATAILLAGTRSALLGLVAGGLVLLARRRTRFSRKHAIAGAGALVLLAVFAFSPAGAKLRARFLWSMDDPFGGARPLLWRDAASMASTRPLSGFGPETFIRDFPRFQSVDLSRQYPDFMHESPHNILLDNLISRGILGPLLTLAVWAIAIVAGIRTRDRPYADALLACCFALLIAHQFVVYVPATAVICALVQACLVAPALVTVPVERSTRPRAVEMAAVVTGLVFLVYAVRLLVGDAWLSAVDRRIASSHADGARNAYSSAVRWLPDGGGSDLYYSRAMAALAAKSSDERIRDVAWSEALQAGVKATKSSEQRHNAWYSLANLLAATGDALAVERSLKNAIAWAPNWFKPHWALAKFLQLTNRPAEALREASVAVALDGGKSPEVAATWATLQASAQR